MLLYPPSVGVELPASGCRLAAAKLPPVKVAQVDALWARVLSPEACTCLIGHMGEVGSEHGVPRIRGTSWLRF